jgi:hypothetical protein
MEEYDDDDDDDDDDKTISMPLDEASPLCFYNIV